MQITAFDIAARAADRFSRDHIEPHRRLAACKAATDRAAPSAPRGELDVPPGYISAEEAERLMRESIEADMSDD